MAPPRRRATGIGFMVLWLTFWLAAILVAIWSMGRAALAGEPAAAIFLAIWTVAAGFGLLNGARRLGALLLDDPTPARPSRNHRWNDGIDAGPTPYPTPGTVPPPPPPADSQR